MPEANFLSSEQIMRSMIEATAQSLHEVAEQVLGEAVRRAPIAPAPYMDKGELQQPGRLRASGHLEPERGVDRKGNKMEIAIVFDAPYALYQHENEEWQHPGGGEAKYLETPLKQMRSRMAAIMGRRVKDALQELVGRR